MVEKEMEIKLDLVNKQFFNRLLKYLPEPKERRRQTNYFFDTKNSDLARSGWALRLRNYDDTAIITAKGPGSNQNKRLTVRPEIEESIGFEELKHALANGMDIKELPEKIFDVFEKNGVRGIVRNTLSFTTFRHIIVYSLDDRQIEFEIDKTEYSDGSIDYELEIEINDQSQFEPVLRGVKKVLEELKIPVNFQSESKFSRARKKIGIVNGSAE